MKKREIQELKSKPQAELEMFLKDSKEKLRGLKFDLAAGKVKDIRVLKSLRKDMARALTFIRENNKTK